MATILSGTAVTFNDNTAQTTAPPIGYKEVYTNTFSSGIFTHAYGSEGVFIIFDILYNGNGSQAREYVSPDMFLVHTTLADYYLGGGSANWQRFHTAKYVYLSDSGIAQASKFAYFIKAAPFVYPAPMQVNMKIFVPTFSAVSSMAFYSAGGPSTQPGGNIAAGGDLGQA